MIKQKKLNLKITVSDINEKKFYEDREEILNMANACSSEGRINSPICIQNLTGNDMMVQQYMAPLGRMVASDSIDKYANRGREQIDAYLNENAGLCRPYLNSDGLFLLRYAKPEESYTGKIYAKITPDNFKELSETPFHPDFELPPNWKGGRGRKNG